MTTYILIPDDPEHAGIVNIQHDDLNSLKNGIEQAMEDQFETKMIGVEVERGNLKIETWDEVCGYAIIFGIKLTEHNTTNY